MIKNTYKSIMHFYPVSGTFVNKFVYHKQNSEAHELTKFLVFKNLRDAGHEVLCEAKLKNGNGRVDIVDLTDKRIIEIVNSETEKSIEEKKKKYPAGFDIGVIDAKVHTESLWKLPEQK